MRKKQVVLNHTQKDEAYLVARSLAENALERAMEAAEKEMNVPKA